MGAFETLAGMSRFERRAAGSDAERRAANWLSDELRHARREARIEAFWCRPNWALTHAWHVGIGLAGTLVAVGSAKTGAAVILIALASVIADALFGRSIGRRLTPEHASQNVVSPVPDGEPPKRVRLIVTANYDAGRTGVVFRDRARGMTAWLRRRTRGLTPGWLGWIVIALVWLELIALVRIGGSGATAIGLAQLPPTVGLVLALAALLEIAGAEFSPAAGDNASGVAVAIALVRALDAAPPRHLHVDLVLQGASDGSGVGLSRYFERRRGRFTRADTLVLGVAACGGGELCWWSADGPLVALGFFAPLRRVAAEIAARDPQLALRSHAGRGTTPALPARLRRLPAITIGATDERGVVPRSHQANDTIDAVDVSTLARAVEAGLLLVDGIDAVLAAESRVPTRA